MISLDKWELSFRAAAKLDRNRVLRAHLRRLGLPAKPERLLEGTIHVVRACVAYLGLDNRSALEFLTRQQYDPKDVAESQYLAIFNIFGRAYARITLITPFDDLDLADLYGTPWEQYERVGYNTLYLSRKDAQDLSAEEIASIDDAVTADLRFDYGEDDVIFDFDPDTLEGVLIVSIQDVITDGE